MSKKNKNGKTRFFVKPEDKIIVGVMKWSNKRIKCDLTDGLNDAERAATMLTAFHLCDYDKVSKAKAICVGDDTFDEETGKKIVDLKLALKWNLYMEKKARKTAQFFSNLSSKMIDKVVEYSNNADMLAEELDRFN